MLESRRTANDRRDFCGLCFFFYENLYIYPAL